MGDLKPRTVNDSGKIYREKTYVGQMSSIVGRSGAKCNSDSTQVGGDCLSALSAEELNNFIGEHQVKQTNEYLEELNKSCIKEEDDEEGEI